MNEVCCQQAALYRLALKTVDAQGIALGRLTERANLATEILQENRNTVTALVRIDADRCYVVTFYKGSHEAGAAEACTGAVIR